MSIVSIPRETLELLFELDDLIRVVNNVYGSGDPLLDRIRASLILAQDAIYTSDEWKSCRSDAEAG